MNFTHRIHRSVSEKKFFATSWKAWENPCMVNLRCAKIDD